MGKIAGYTGRSIFVRRCGQYIRENLRKSIRKPCENHGRRKSKDFYIMKIIVELVDNKRKPNWFISMPMGLIFPN